MGYIYKITNDVNGKIYIGKTSYNNPEKRWNEHLNDYKKRKCEKRPLYSAMNKYGTEHFHFEVIEETNSPEEREQYWIETLRTYVGFDDCHGYNATLGGDGKSYLNLNEDEVIHYHISEANYHVEETSRKFGVDRKTIKNILIRNDIKTLSRNENNVEIRGVYVCKINADTGELLCVFRTYADANEHMGKDRNSSVIRMATYRKSHIAYGFKWMRYEDYLKLNINTDMEELVS